MIDRYRFPVTFLLLLDRYVDALRHNWVAWWTSKVRKKWRKVKFFVWRRRTSCMETLVNRFSQHFGSETTALIFGNGANSGVFGRLRGSGVPGPVKEVRRRLSKKYTVIGGDEYNTSARCLGCGERAKFYNHGVTYCSNNLHDHRHRMWNRDSIAAYKIGARWLAGKAGDNLGPWATGSRKDAPGSRILFTTLVAYQNRVRALE